MGFHPPFLFACKICLRSAASLLFAYTATVTAFLAFVKAFVAATVLLAAVKAFVAATISVACKYIS